MGRGEANANTGVGTGHALSEKESPAAGIGKGAKRVGLGVAGEQWGQGGQVRDTQPSQPEVGGHV